MLGSWSFKIVFIFIEHKITQFLKLPIFEASQALHKIEGPILKKKSKVIPPILMQFWSRIYLDKLDWLTPQDL